MKYRFESANVQDNSLHLQGFLIGSQPSSQGAYALFDHADQPVDFELNEVVRNDVGDRFFGKVVENHYGFSIVFPYHSGEQFDLQMTIEKKVIHITVNDAFLKRTNAWNSFKNNAGVQNLVFKIRNLGKGRISYPKWYAAHKASKTELQKQRERIWEKNSPVFSIVIPLYNTPEKFLKELIDTLLGQTYAKFEVCFADGSADSALKQIIDQYHDERLKYQHLDHNGGISENTNAAIAMAKGDFIVLCDHDDLLCENALYEFADAITADDEIDVLYSDEDKIDNAGVLFQPHFKPDYDPDLLASNNYICHLFSVRRTFVEQYGSFSSVYDGAQDHDFIFRMCEHAGKVAHIAKVLYHWRSHAASTASNANAKLYAFTAGAKAVQDHYQRVYPQYPVDHVDTGISYGIYHTYFHIEEEPLISIIIPNKDHIEELKKAVASLEEKSSWKNFEIIIVENNSEGTDTFAYYDECTKQYANIKVVKYEGSFNYSAINNFGVKHALGEYYLFLNNDTELIEPDSLEEMFAYARREDAGAVGCRLLYPDQTLQHAGVIIGIGVADHIFKGQLSDNGQTYFNRAMTVQDYSAVTAAAMMMKKSVFEQVNGFDEKLAVAFNDVDLCLRIRALGKLIIYNPYACFYHYESKSRGRDDSPEKRARYMSELELFNSRWAALIQKGDPYYNPNLSLQATDCSLRNE